MSVALELRALQCLRGNRVLFSDLSVTVQPGEMLRVQGENGAGKTSLLRLICGLSTPSRGDILWYGRPVSRIRDDFNLQLVYLSHAPALKDDLSALENLQASGGLAGLSCSEQEASLALVQAGLGGCERLPARLLSQGQRKRAALARLALSTACGLWVLDEPFNALDEAACAWLQGLIAAQLARGAVVVLTSHQGRTWDAAQPQVAVTLPSKTAAVTPPALRIVGHG